MSDTKRNVGQKMMDKLAEIGRAKKRAGTATTEELARAAGVPVGQAYSRLYWLEAREGMLSSTGKGSSRVWKLTADGRAYVKRTAGE